VVVVLLQQSKPKMESAFKSVAIANESDHFLLYLERQLADSSKILQIYTLMDVTGQYAVCQ
jgi:hypothetical protein